MSPRSRNNQGASPQQLHPSPSKVELVQALGQELVEGREGRALQLEGDLTCCEANPKTRRDPRVEGGCKEPSSCRGKGTELALLWLDAEGGSPFRDHGGASKGPGRVWLVAGYPHTPPQDGSRCRQGTLTTFLRCELWPGHGCRERSPLRLPPKLFQRRNTSKVHLV